MGLCRHRPAWIDFFSGPPARICTVTEPPALQGPALGDTLASFPADGQQLARMLAAISMELMAQLPPAFSDPGHQTEASLLLANSASAKLEKTDSAGGFLGVASVASEPQGG